MDALTAKTNEIRLWEAESCNSDRRKRSGASRA